MGAALSLILLCPKKAFRFTALLWQYCMGIKPLPLLASRDRTTFLCNHCSIADAYIDFAQCDGTLVVRTLAAYGGMMSTLVGFLSNKIIVISRGTTSRQELMDKCAGYNRIILYPEGTRRPHAQHISPLKVGGLKNAYDARNTVQVVMTSGKDSAIDEKRLSAKMFVRLRRIVMPPITATEYDEFDAFKAAVEKSWEQGWNHLFFAQDTSGESDMNERMLG